MKWILDKLVNRIIREIDLNLTANRPVAGKPQVKITLEVLFQGKKILTKIWTLKI